MKILLIDTDSKIPNLALMKLSTFHKEKGHSINLKKLGFTGYRSKRAIVEIDNTLYDRTYVSTIFTVNKNKVTFKTYRDVIIGGTAYTLANLPTKIDDTSEDYSIYPTNKASFGFITRGCPRKCSFCIVPEKEGGVYKYRDINQIVKHDKVFFMDNNILAYDKHLDILAELVDSKIKCQFNQGLDMRLITHENAQGLANLNYIANYTFAFDHINLERQLDIKLSILRKYIISDWKIRMFVLGGYDSTIADDIYRIEWCRKNKVLPYYMRHDKCWDSLDKNFYTDMASWCNQPGFFKNMSFEEFVIKRNPNDPKRAMKNIILRNSNLPK